VNQRPLVFLVISALFSYPLGLILLNYVFIVLGILLLFGSYIWIFITALFTMDNCYRKTVEWDEKIKNWPKPVNHIVRWGLFIGGAFFATELLLALSNFLLSVNDPFYDYQLVITYLYLNMWFIIWVLFIIGFAFVIFKKVNLWLGVFFIFISVFAIILMISAFQLYYGNSVRLLPLIILEYIFSLYLLLSSTALLFDERAETIARKLNIAKSEMVIIVVIFSLASFELVSGLVGESLAKSELYTIALVFPYLALIFGIYAIIKNSRKKTFGQTESEGYSKDNQIEKSEIIEGDKEMKNINSESITCYYCGVENSINNQYCTNCGKDLYKTS
jgi:hypothetical protein